MDKITNRALLSGQFMTLIALEMTNPFLPLYLSNTLNLSSNFVIWYSALSFALPMLSNLIMAPLWGKMGDRFGYKLMVLRSAFALALTQFLITFIDNLIWILLIRVLQGGIAGFISAIQAYSIALWPIECKSKKLGELNAIKAIASTLGGLVGGILLIFVSFKILFVIGGILCFISAFFMHKYLPVVSSIKKTNHLINKSMPVKRLFIVISCLISLTQVAKFLPEADFSYYFHDVLKLKPWIVGFLYSLPSLAIFLTSKWSNQHFDKIRKDLSLVQRYFFSYLALAILCMIAHSLTDSILFLAIVRFGWGLVLGALLPTLFSLLSDYSDNTGYVMGLAHSFSKFGNLIGLLLGGFMAPIIAIQGIFLLTALIYFLMLLLCLSLNKHQKMSTCTALILDRQ